MRVIKETKKVRKGKVASAANAEAFLLEGEPSSEIRNFQEGMAIMRNLQGWLSCNATRRKPGKGGEAPGEDRRGRDGVQSGGTYDDNPTRNTRGSTARIRGWQRSNPIYRARCISRKIFTISGESLRPA
ncbi:hypothetical protein KM043_013101 [Ampulex compressa]|nr:hypothetical protein KM043_013101 [Ampulex compressa]